MWPYHLSVRTACSVYSEFTGVPLKLLLDRAGVDYKRARYVLRRKGAWFLREPLMELVGAARSSYWLLGGTAKCSAGKWLPLTAGARCSGVSVG
jgi:hypothetical protein